MGPYGDGLTVVEPATEHLLPEGSHEDGTSAETPADAHPKVQKNGAKWARTEKQKVANYAKKKHEVRMPPEACTYGCKTKDA